MTAVYHLGCYAFGWHTYRYDEQLYVKVVLRFAAVPLSHQSDGVNRLAHLRLWARGLVSVVHLKVKRAIVLQTVLLCCTCVLSVSILAKPSQGCAQF